MAFKIDDIRGGLIGGGARPTLFQVEIFNPVTTEAQAATTLLVQSTTLPSSTINSIEIPYFGRKIKIAGDRTFDTWAVDVMNDEDFKIRHSLERWHNNINSMEGNLNGFGSSNPSNYKRTAVVTQFGKKGNVIRRYNFVGLFPLDIAQIDLSWDATDRIETFGVTFAYDYWTADSGPGTII